MKIKVFHFCISVTPQWDAMKLSLMIEEANKISAKLKKNTVFSRYDKMISCHGLQMILLDSLQTYYGVVLLLMGPVETGILFITKG